MRKVLAWSKVTELTCAKPASSRSCSSDILCDSFMIRAMFIMSLSVILLFLPGRRVGFSAPPWSYFYSNRYKAHLWTPIIFAIALQVLFYTATSPFDPSGPPSSCLSMITDRRQVSWGGEHLTYRKIINLIKYPHQCKPNESSRPYNSNSRWRNLKGYW